MTHEAGIETTMYTSMKLNDRNAMARSDTP